MIQEKGNLSINSENFLPIIKKWLYTDKDIFIRELVSNACDAVTKLKKLASMGEADISDDETFQIHVTLDKEAHTLTITDNGIGMTADEIKKYINQIAFSGATDFLQKFQEKAEEDNEIIGHFGLGFYSAFMVADKVEIDTLSYQKEAQSAKWICTGGIDYEMQAGSKTERGTSVTLFLGEDGKEFLEETTLYAALRKYCSFMPVPIYVHITQEETEQKEEQQQENSNVIHVSPEEAENITSAEEAKKLSEEKKEAQQKEEPKPLNETNPLWLRQPKDCTDEEYKAFYHEVFMDMNDPLFWIHLNMDYPFRLKGILYFPKLVQHTDITEGEIKLYSNQVYIADNIKEVVPEFLLLLKGVMDCPDLPLNVSRSALQNDGYAQKMSNYITKKVADKLNQLFKNERQTYEGFWDNISLFIKFGCMREEKLYDKIKDSLLLKTTDRVYETISEYLEKNKQKHENKIFFVSDENQQAQYIRLFKEQGLEAAILSSPIDKPFVSFLEYKNPGVKVQRIDADISDTLQQKEEEKDEDAKKAEQTLNTELESLFRGILGKETLKVKAEPLKAKQVSGMIILTEESRRMLEMKEAYGENDQMKMLFAHAKPDETLILNSNHKLVELICDWKGKEEKKQDLDLICHQVYDLALMSHKTLSSEEMTTFIDRSNLLLEKLAEYQK